jgi:WD40 repeat protein
MKVAVLGDGRLIVGTLHGQVRIWDPAVPSASPVELGSHDSWITALAVLPDDLVVTGDHYGQVRVWDILHTAEVARASCSVTALAAARHASAGEHLLMAHQGQGLTMWSVSRRDPS